MLQLLFALVVLAQNQPRVDQAWPFDAAEAARRQAETVRALTLPDPLKVGSLTFRLIPAGKFELGSPKTEPGHEGAETLKPETIAEPLYMLETQLPIEGYRELMNVDPPEPSADADPKRPAALLYRDVMDKV